MPSDRTIMLGRDAPVAIVGGGIAGLTAALSFAEAGFPIEVFERAPELAAAGAGIQVSANALRVLTKLGLGDALAVFGIKADAVRLRSHRTGHVIAEIPVAADDSGSYLSIHRADLQRVLLDAVRASGRIGLHLGCELTGAVTQADGVRLTFANGLERRAAFLIGADGVHSAVAAVLGLPRAKASGVVAWRMMLDREAEGSDTAHGIEAWLGPARHAVAYPLRAGRQVNLVLIAGRELAGEDDADPGGAKARLQQAFRRWDPRLLRMVEAAGHPSAWPLWSTPIDRPWGPAERVLLIGDAAHAMLPYAAQGAAMAIEDAWVAAAAFSKARTPAEAVAAYCAMRSGRIARVRRRVAFHQLVYHLPFPLSIGRDLVLARRDPRSLRKDLAWLYDWTPPEL